MKQKILAALFAVFMMMAVFSVNTQAAETEEVQEIIKEFAVEGNAAAFSAAAQSDTIEVVDWGYCGNSEVMWGITSEGILLIVSDTQGATWSMKSYNAPWAVYEEYIWAIMVQGTVKNVPGELFNGYPALEYVYLEEGVKTIGGYAFSTCYNLVEIEIASTVENIEMGAFSACNHLSVINLPTSLKSVSDRVFAGCTSLTKMTIPNGVTQIGAHSFENCTKLASVSLPGSLKVIGEYAFNDCALKDLSIPSGVTEIKTNAFSNNNFEKVVFPNAVTTLGTNVLENCTKLKEVDLPDYISAIPENMFAGCTSLKTVTIPGYVTEIGGGAFAKCASMSKMRIPGSVTTVGDAAFSSCPNLKEVLVMNEDVEFGSNIFKSTGSEFVIRCHENSTAHTYALNNSHPYEFIDMSKVTECFADIMENKWYTGAVQYVFDKELMSGSGEYFKPTQNVTRAQVITTLYRLAGSPEVTDYSACEVFSDVAEGKYYTDAVCWSYNEGVATGNGDKYYTTGNLNRQQMAAFFFRFADYMGYDTTESADISSMLNADQVSSYAVYPMEWAVGSGLISGSETKDELGNIVYDLNPKGNTTRAQMATILQRFCEYYHI